MEPAFAGLKQLCELMLDYVDRPPVPRLDAPESLSSPVDSALSQVSP